MSANNSKPRIALRKPILGAVGAYGQHQPNDNDELMHFNGIDATKMNRELQRANDDTRSQISKKTVKYRSRSYFGSRVAQAKNSSKKIYEKYGRDDEEEPEVVQKGPRSANSVKVSSKESRGDQDSQEAEMDPYMDVMLTPDQGAKA